MAVRIATGLALFAEAVLSQAALANPAGQPGRGNAARGHHVPSADALACWSNSFEFGKGFVLAGLHRYASKGSYSVTLTISDAGGSQLTKTVSITVK